MAEVIKTIKPTAGDYATLSAWEAGEQRALASGEVAVAECYTFAGGLNNQCAFNGWTFADSTSRIVVRGAIGNRHNGVAGAGFYLTRASAVVPISVAASHNVDFQHIEIDGGGFNERLIALTGVSVNSNADNLILRNSGTSYAIDGVATNVGIWNNVLIYNCARGYYSPANTGLIVNNWTVYGGVYGIVRAKAINCGCFGQTTASFLSPIAGSDYNVSSDATAPGTNKATGKNAYTDYFIDPANGDFHLKNTSLVLFGLSGADLSAIFTTDIDGVIRTLPFDIGADQYVAAGGPTSVYSDFAIPWDMFQTVSSDFSVKWDLLNSVQSDLSVKFDTLNTVFADLSIPWDVYQTVNGDLSIVFDLRNTVQSDLQILWDSAGTVFSDCTIKWDLGDVGGRITIIGSGFRRFIG